MLHSNEQPSKSPTVSPTLNPTRSPTPAPSQSPTISVRVDSLCLFVLHCVEISLTLSIFLLITYTANQKSHWGTFDEPFKAADRLAQYVAFQVAFEISH